MEKIEQINGATGMKESFIVGAPIRSNQESERLLQFFTDDALAKEILNKISTKSITTQELHSLIQKIHFNEVKKWLLEYETIVLEWERGMINFFKKNHLIDSWKNQVVIDFNNSFEGVSEEFLVNFEKFITNKRFFLRKVDSLMSLPTESGKARKFRLVFNLFTDKGVVFIKSFDINEIR